MKLLVTNTRALLGIVDAPWGSNPAFCFHPETFSPPRSFLACRSDEEARVYRLLDSTGSLGHGLIHPLVSSALEIVFLGTLSRNDGFALVFLCMILGQL